MKGYSWSLLQLAFTGAALATVPLSDVKRVSSASVVPNKFVVEVESASEIPGKRSLYTVCCIVDRLASVTHDLV